MCGVEYPSEGLARCETSSEKIGEVNGIAINRRRMGEVYGLPDKEDGVYLIVSAIVAQKLSGLRDDVLVVDETIRDENGRIIGAKSLARI